MAYADVVNALNPIVYYRLGESSGTTAVDETGNYDGTYNGSPTLSSTGLLTGDVDTSVQLNGTNQNVTCPTPTLCGTSTAFSFSALIDFTDQTFVNGQYQTIATLKSTGSSSFKIGVTNNATYSDLFLGYGGGNGFKATVDLSQSFHLTITSDGTNHILYINGLVVGITSTSPLASNSNATIIGSDSTSGYDNHFSGIIDEVAIFNTALTSNQVLELYTHAKVLPVKADYPTTVNNLSPIAYYRLGEASGTTAVDETGNYDGTYNGTTTLSSTSLLVGDSDTSVDFADSAYVDLDLGISGVNSVSLLVNTSTTGVYQSLVSFWDNDSTKGILLACTSSESNALLWKGNASAVTSNVVITDGNTHHIAISYDGNTNTDWWIDGVKQPSYAGNLLSDSVASIAGYRDSGGVFSAYGAKNIDEVSFFTTTLTQDEIFALYASSKGVKVSGIGTYQNGINGLNPLAYLRLGESSGSIAVDETGNYNGTYNGSPTKGQTGLLVNNNDTAVTFNGGTDSVSFGAQLLGNEYSIAMLFNNPTINQDEALIAQYSSGVAGRMALYMLNTTTLQFLQNPSSINFTISPNTTYHLVATRASNGDMELFIDGVSVGTANSSEATPSLNTLIGEWSFGNYSGTIDEVAIFNKVLTSTEIADMYDWSKGIGLGAGKKITGTITETLAITNWIVRCFNLTTGALIVEQQTTDGTFDIDMLPYDAENTYQFVTVIPDQGSPWQPSTAYVLDDLVFPTDPATTSYYYKCTTAGTTATTEPTWPTNVAGAVNDGTAVWEMVENLVQPITHSPLLPA